MPPLGPLWTTVESWQKEIFRFYSNFLVRLGNNDFTTESWVNQIDNWLIAWHAMNVGGALQMFADCWLFRRWQSCLVVRLNVMLVLSWGEIFAKLLLSVDVNLQSFLYNKLPHPEAQHDQAVQRKLCDNGKIWVDKYLPTHNTPYQIGVTLSNHCPVWKCIWSNIRLT